MCFVVVFLFSFPSTGRPPKKRWELGGFESTLGTRKNFGTAKMWLDVVGPVHHAKMGNWTFLAYGLKSQPDNNDKYEKFLLVLYYCYFHSCSYCSCLQ